MKSALITGASSGIGLATARRLAEKGFRVFAGVRRPFEQPEPFESLRLDVTDPASVEEARRTLGAALGDAPLDALVNNAGVGDLRPLEWTSREQFRSLFEVNVFGLVEVTRVFLDLLRRGPGRIVNIGSIGGLFGLPFASALCASKHAVEAVSDALRLELWSSGIRVTLLEPASINSGAAEKIAAQVESTIASYDPVERSRYEAALRGVLAATMESETHGSPPDIVAEAVWESLQAAHPPARRVVGKDGVFLNALARFFPAEVRDAMLRKKLLGDPGADETRSP